jgi:hypothetical protein
MEGKQWPANREYLLIIHGYGEDNETLGMTGCLPADAKRLAEWLELCGDGVIVQVFHLPLDLPAGSRFTGSAYIKSEKELLAFLKVPLPKVIFRVVIDDSSRAPTGKVLFSVAKTVRVLKGGK